MILHTCRRVVGKAGFKPARRPAVAHSVAGTMRASARPRSDAGGVVAHEYPDVAKRNPSDSSARSRGFTTTVGHRRLDSRLVLGPSTSSMPGVAIRSKSIGWHVPSTIPLSSSKKTLRGGFQLASSASCLAHRLCSLMTGLVQQPITAVTRKVMDRPCRLRFDNAES